MFTKIAAAFFSVPLLAIAAVLVWIGLRGIPQQPAAFMASTPVAVLSETLSEGLVEAQVYNFADQVYQFDIQFSPSEGSTIPSDMAPEVALSMDAMHMDGIDQPLQTVEPGKWRAKTKLPMAGKWVMSVGYGDEFAELQFTVE